MNTKKSRTTLLIGIGVAVLAAGLLAGTALAQRTTPPPGVGGFGMGYGMMGDHENGGFDYEAMHAGMAMFGVGDMHTVVLDNLAVALGLTTADLEAEMASGNTLLEIAEARGVGREELAAAMEASMAAGLEQAVADGVLSQADADWMQDQMGEDMLLMFDYMGAMGGFGGCAGH